jgi:O-antigen ligase
MHSGRTWNGSPPAFSGTASGTATADFGTLVLCAVLMLLVVASPLSVLAEGRNLASLNFVQDIDADGAGAWMLRLSTLAIVGGSLLVIALGLGGQGGEGRTAVYVFAGYVIFFVTNSVPEVSARAAYPLLVLTAIFLQRNQHELLFDVVKWSLAAVILGSLALAPLVPEMMLRSYAPELRLPYVPFRFWGLGNSPNSTGPLALALIMMAMHQPFRLLALQLFVLTGAFAVLVLTQSQTAWVTAAVILPLYLVYRWRVDDGEFARDQGGFIWLAAAFAFLIAVTLYLLSAIAAGIADTAMTGRGKIWRTAVDLYTGNPIFGYGPTAWDTAFRIRVGMPFAFTAHNQVLQSLSTAGVVGLAGWFIYLTMLVLAAARLSRATRGLAPAMLFAFSFMRSFSEASFDFRVITADEFLLHVILFVLLTGAWQYGSEKTRQKWIKAHYAVE